MNIGAYELQILVSGKPIREYGHQQKSYVEGRKGQPFSLRFRNNTSSRVLAVISVDGLNVIDGEPATPQSNGYVVEGYSSVEVKGWRKSLQEVAQFLFTERKSSYAGKTEGTDNCGVVGVCVIKEKVVPPSPVYIYHVPQEPVHLAPTWVPPSPSGPFHYGPMWSHYGHTTAGNPDSGSDMRVCNYFSAQNSAQSSLSADDLSSALNASLSQVSHNLGTGWGTNTEDRVNYTNFTRGEIGATLELFYSDAAGLDAAGISRSKEVNIAVPRAFPGFCKAPR